MKGYSLEEQLHVITCVQTALELKKKLKAIMDSVSEALGADASSVLLLERQQTHSLYFQVATGKKAQKVLSFKVEMGQGIAGWVAKKRKALLVKDVSKDPRFHRDLAEKIGFMPSSILCTPLIANRKLLGVLEVLRGTQKEPFEPSDLLFLEQVSAAIAASLANSLLFETVRGKARKYEERQRVSRLWHGQSEFSEQSREALLREKEGLAPLLLSGNTGTGKTHFARCLHQLRGASLPLLIVRVTRRQKHPRWANLWSSVGKGTLLVENIEQLSSAGRKSLEKGLRDGYLHPVTRQIEPITCKQLFTTKEPLTHLTDFPSFLLDVFYTSSILLPPLAEREEDVIPIAYAFLERLNEANGLKKTFAEGFRLFLTRAILSENAHTLKEIVGKAYQQAQHSQLYLEDVPAHMRKWVTPHFVLPFAILFQDYVQQLQEVVGKSAQKKAKLAGLSFKHWEKLVALHRAIGKKKA